MGVSSRLREIAKIKSMSLKDISDVTGVKYRTIQNYVAEERSLGSEFLTAMSTHLGVSASWILSGEGPMMLPSTGERSIPQLDRDRLCLAIEAVEEGLDAFDRVASPEIKAGLIIAAYELLEAEGEKATAQIIRLVKSA